MEWTPSRQVTILQILVAIANPSGVTMILVCHVISKDHMIKGSCYFIGEAPQLTHHPAKFSGDKHCDGGDMTFPHVFI